MMPVYVYIYDVYTYFADSTRGLGCIPHEDRRFVVTKCKRVDSWEQQKPKQTKQVTALNKSI